MVADQTQSLSSQSLYSRQPLKHGLCTVVFVDLYDHLVGWVEQGLVLYS